MARKARATVQEARELARAVLLANVEKTASDDRLGDLTLYDLVPGWRKPVAEVRRVFANHGLSPDHVLPCAPDWNVSFGRALEQVSARIRPADYELKAAAKGAGDERRVAVVRIARNGRVTTADLGTVACPAARNDAPPFVERSDPEGFTEAVVQATREFHEVYTLDDIRTAITAHIDRFYGLPLRRQPPYIAYWVPAAGTTEIEHLRDAIEELGAGQIEMMTGYKSDPKSQRMAVNTVNKGLEGQLNEFKAEADKFCKADPASTRASTIEDMIAQAKVLREQAQLYKAMLGADIVNVETQYKAVQAALKKLLGTVEEAHEAA